ncbi:unnamed protein product [Lathyrus oleraceus]
MRSGKCLYGGCLEVFLSSPQLGGPSLNFLHFENFTVASMWIEVVFGSLILIMTAAKRLGLYSALRACDGHLHKTELANMRRSSVSLTLVRYQQSI